MKTQKMINLDAEVASKVNELIPKRQFSSLINRMLQEYFGLEKTRDGISQAELAKEAELLTIKLSEVKKKITDIEEAKKKEDAQWKTVEQMEKLR